MRQMTCVLLGLLLSAQVLQPALLEAKSSGGIMGRISGKDGGGVMDAVITIFRQNQDGGTISFTRTDKTGFYRLSNISPGNYYLQVSREGYQPTTSSNVNIAAGKIATINIILQELIDFISDDKDPRNWDLKTVLRSTSDRRMIFRELPGEAKNEMVEADAPFFRSGTVNVASSAGLGSENYSVFPSSGQDGIVSNFAFTEPVSERSRMILSGQLSSGFDSYWRIRNTFNYRPQPDRDIKVSVGYGRMTLSSPSTSNPSRPAEFLTQDPSLRDSGIQTLALGFEGKNRILDAVAVEYGFDLSRISYGSTKSLFSPYFQLIVTPADTWTLKTALMSRRYSEANSLTLADGDVLNLMEPAYLAKINGEVHLSQYKHSELSIAKSLDENTIELAVYEDRLDGPGTPFLVSAGMQDARRQNMIQLREDQASQRGLRVAVSRKLLDYLSGSVAYVYASGANITTADSGQPADVLARNLLNYVHHSYYHSLKGELRARLPRTNTSLAAGLRWYPGDSLTPIDLFADRMDLLTKGLNFAVRQPIPLPEFMGSAGRWEALLDVRNLFDQGMNIIHTSSGDLLLIRNPRSLRFGINLNFY
jgi:hypothetical protein